MIRVFATSIACCGGSKVILEYLRVLAQILQQRGNTTSRRGTEGGGEGFRAIDNAVQMGSERLPIGVGSVGKCAQGGSMDMAHTSYIAL